jgi:hypothetical protein
MKRLILAMGLAALLLAMARVARADHPCCYPGYNRHDRVARYHAAHMPWHAPYYYTPWGQPTALVVPPTSTMHTEYSWGVAQTRMTPIYHQFDRPYPGDYANGGSAGLLGTPRWPSDTTQFGVYPVRGPW